MSHLHKDIINGNIPVKRLVWSSMDRLGSTVRRRKDIQEIPAEPGVYTFTSTKDHEQLLYIGQTKRLRHGSNALSVNACADRMPFNDPHTAAQSLWILRVEENMAFEFSGTPTTLNEDRRRGLEHMLQWKYHSEKGESPLVSHGRFHARYFRSGSRKSGKRGGLLPPGQINPASGPSSCPLELFGKPWERSWMGLSWSEPIEMIKERLGAVPTCSGLYKILEASTNRLLLHR